MRIQFENWIKSQLFGTEAESLFEEAVLCYKASAYRAALLFSYIGFQTVIRNRILTAKQPANVSDTYWKTIQSNLRDDDKWDNQAYDALQMKNPGPIFRLSEDVRNQLTYWKNRRNDCAHSKDNKIDFAHVEAFWLFIQSNLAKCLVNGSKESLLGEIRILFDRSQTPAGADYSYVVKQLPSAIERAELPTFFEEVDKAARKFGRYQNIEDITRLINGILNVNDDVIVQALINFLKLHEKLLLALLREHPNRIQFFAEDKSFIRKLWHQDLFTSKSDDSPLYCSLLRNKLIPESRIEEAHENAIKSGHPFSADAKTLCIDLLKENGFFDVYKKVVFENEHLNDWNWANANTELILFYLAKYEIDYVVAKGIKNTFSAKHYPYDLKSELDQFFEADKDKYEEFKNAILHEELSFTQPQHLNKPSHADR